MGDAIFDIDQVNLCHLRRGDDDALLQSDATAGQSGTGAARDDGDIVLSQYFQYGQYKVLVMKKRGGVASWRHLVPVLFVVALTLSVLLGLALRSPLILLGVALPYLAANMLASIWTARKQLALLPYLPIAFAVLHFAYGLGWLSGFWKWRGR